MLTGRRKSWRGPSALAMVAGMALAAFEIRRLQQGDQEAWFWVCVAGLMAVLGLAGVLGIGTGDDEAKL